MMRVERVNLRPRHEMKKYVWLKMVDGYRAGDVYKAARGDV